MGKLQFNLGWLTITGNDKGIVIWRNYLEGAKLRKKKICEIDKTLDSCIIRSMKTKNKTKMTR